MTKPPSLRRNIAYSSGLTILNALFPLLILPYVLRALGPESIGLVNWSASIVAYFGIVSGLGVGIFAIREAARLRHDSEALTLFFNRIVHVLFLASLLAFVVFASVVAIVPGFRKLWPLFLLSGTQLVINAFTIDWLFVALERYRTLFFRNLAVKMATILAVFTWIDGPEDSLVYVGIIVGSALMTNGWNVISAARWFRFTRLFPEWTSVRDIAGRSGPLFALALIVGIYQNAPTLILGFLVTAKELGYYSTVLKILQLCLSLTGSITAVLLPRLTSLHAQGEDTAWQAILKRYFVLTALLASAATAALVALAGPLMHIYSGDRFDGAVWMLQIMAPVILISSLGSQITQLAFISRGREITVIIAALLGAALSTLIVVLGNWTNPALMGSLAMVVAELAVLSILVTTLENDLRKILFGWSLLKSIAPAIVALPLMMGVVALVPGYWLQFVLGGLVGVLVIGVGGYPSVTKVDQRTN